MGCKISGRKGLPHPTVLLFWIRTYLPRRLSTNVLREIHYYLRGPYLADFQSTQLSIFDVGTRTWRTTALHLNYDACKTAYYVLLSPHEVFLAGNAETYMESRKAFIFSVSGTVKRLPDMLLSGFPGLFHNQPEGSVIAFGGGILEPKREVQSYSLARNCWTLWKQQMYYPRNFFQPCQYLSLLYIFKAGDPDIEYYCLKTGLFHLMQINVNAFDNYGGIFTITVPFKKMLYQINHQTYTRLNLEEKNSTQVKRTTYQPFMTYGWAVLNGTFITVNFPFYWMTDLETFEYAKCTAPIARKY